MTLLSEAEHTFFKQETRLSQLDIHSTSSQLSRCMDLIFAMAHNKNTTELGAVAHASNLGTLGGSQEDDKVEPTLGDSGTW